MPNVLGIPSYKVLYDLLLGKARSLNMEPPGGEPIEVPMVGTDWPRMLIDVLLRQKPSIPEIPVEYVDDIEMLGKVQVDSGIPKLTPKMPTVKEETKQKVQPIQPINIVQDAQSAQPTQATQANQPEQKKQKQPSDFALGLASTLANIAAGIAPQNTWAAGLAGQAQAMTQNEAFRRFLTRALAGENNPFQGSPIAVPTSAEAIGLSPKEQMAGVSGALTKRAQELEEKKAPFNAYYQMALAKSALEKTAMDKLQMLASFANESGVKMDSVKVDLGDKIALLAFDPKEGRHKVTLTLKKGQAPGSKGKDLNTSYLTLGRKEAATSLFPIVEDVIRTMFSEEKKIADRLNALKDDKGSLNIDALIATARNLSPELANIWDSYFTRLEQTLKSGGNISDVMLPKVKKNSIRLKDGEFEVDANVKAPEFYTGIVPQDGGLKYVILFKPENSENLIKVFEYEIPENKKQRK